MEKLGYGKDYKYAHNFPDHIVEQDHLPAEVKERKYYLPSDSGHEQKIKERLKNWEALKKESGR
jgi:putative ATPase